MASTKPYWDKIPANQDRFIVFRILKGSEYQYIWVRVKLNNSILITGISILTVYNGKYQMNNIVTGQ